MLRLADIGFDAPDRLLAGLGLVLSRVPDGEPIPGSYWGECEAGLIGSTVFARADTPVHSLLHEAGHLLVMPPERRAADHARLNALLGLAEALACRRANLLKYFDETDVTCGNCDLCDTPVDVFDGTTAVRTALSV